MDSKTFNDLVESVMLRVRNILAAKNQEYVPGENENRFANFYKGAVIQNIPVLEAWRGYFTKHLVSLFDIIQYPGKFPKHIVKEKIQDLIAYLIIFEGLWTETSEEKKD